MITILRRLYIILINHEWQAKILNHFIVFPFMSIIDFISMALFIATIIYISLKQIETFKIKLLVSIPFIILIFLFSRSFVLLPIYIYSLIAATYLYTIFFYIPFAIDFILILISSLDHMATLKLLLISISVPMLMSMFLDKNMKKYGLENEEHKGKDIKRESYRDYFQIGTGIITILVFVFFGHFGKVIILYSVLLIYLFGNILYLHKDYRITNLVYRMERENTKLGLGSMYLASGFLLVMGFIGSIKVLYVAAFLIMVGDSLATIIGMRLRTPRLVYNNKKSVGGFLAMCIPSFIFGVFFIFYVPAIFYSVFATFAESISNKIADDNITIPVSIIIAHFILAVA